MKLKVKLRGGIETKGKVKGLNWNKIKLRDLSKTKSKIDGPTMIFYSLFILKNEKTIMSNLFF